MKVRHTWVLVALATHAGLCGPLPESTGRSFFQRHCFGCHNTGLKTGGLALDAANPDDPAAQPEVWEKVVRKLRAHSMPPAGVPRPDEATYRAVTTRLETALDRAAAAHPDPGRTDTFRRLNRTEYQNAIRDLLALDVDVTSLLPGDDLSYGFDNVTVGDLSPTLLERYLAAARKISRLALGTPPRSAGGDTFTLPPDLTQESHFEDLPIGTRGGTSLRYTFPVDGTYEIQIRLQRDRNEHVEGLRESTDVELLIDGARVRLFTVKPPPFGQDHHAVDQGLAMRLPVTAGPHRLAATFPTKGTPLIESERQPWFASFNMDRHPRIQPAVYSLSVLGPYETRGPGDTPSRRRILVCRPTSAQDEEPCARKILSVLGRRAYRRPVTGADLEALLGFYRDARKQGTFDSALEMAVSAVLVSPHFLFRIERDPGNVSPGTAYRVTDLELASRLSFFLWSSIPDDALLDAAIAGKLKQPGELERQARRMLADGRARALVTNFAQQWLYLRNLASVTPDMRLFPDFDDNLRRAFLEETELFFESILRQERSVVDLLNADYTFLNERLAKHYGIAGIYGSRFRRIEFGDTGARGGLLRQGSVLTVTSYATRTSPVLRGKWILDNILGMPPPPPPATVPALKENASGSKPIPMRERLAQHRANPACAGCHNLMDPIGFSLENYDALGRWRTADEGTPIDAAGSLPDGTRYQGVNGLQKALVQRPELFAATLTEKLMTYGLGRGVTYRDAPAIRKIVTRSARDDYKLSSLILGIVQSTPFQMRRSP